MTKRRNQMLLLAIVALGALGLAAPNASARAQAAPAACKDGAQSAATAGRPTASVCTRAIAGADDVLDAGKCLGNLAACAIGQVGGGVAGEIGGAVGDAVGGVAGAVGNGVMDEITNWFAKGVGKLVAKIQKKVEKSTTPVVTANWFKREYMQMMGIAGILAVTTLMLALLGALFKRDAMAVFKAAFVQLPLALIGTAAALIVVQMLLTITDSMTTMMTDSYERDLGDLLVTTNGVFGAASSGAPVDLGGPMTLLVSLLALLGSFLVFIELAVREAAIYITLLFLPLAAVASVWPPAKQVISRMCSLMMVVIFSKFAICVIFVLGAKIIVMAGIRGTDGASGVIAGMATMFLAAMAPATILGMLSLNAVSDVPGRNHIPGPTSVISTAQKANSIRGMTGSSSSGPEGGPSSISGGGGKPGGGPGGGGGGAAPSGGSAGGGGGAAAAGGAATAGVAVAAMAASAAAKKSNAVMSGVAESARPQGSGLPTSSGSERSPSKSPAARSGGDAASADTAVLPSPNSTSGKAPRETPRSGPPHLAGKPAANNLKELPSV